MPVISQRVLNRTLLERQLLARRTHLDTWEAIRHLIAVQGQEPNWPYVGLWARLAGFRAADLEALLHDRSVVRSTVIRRTIHLVDSEDFGWLRPTVESIVSAALRHPYYVDEIAGLDHGKLAEAGRELLTGRMLTRKELGRLLAERFPDRHPGRLADSVEILEPLVHGPAAGIWGGWRNRSGFPVVRAEEWTGRPMRSAQPETMIMRYLAAFGPASIMDMQAWAGITRLREAVEELRPRLRVHRNESGRELFDLPDAPLAEPDAPAPVRFLPAFDNALLGHKDRTRVISEEDRRRVAPRASGGVPMFLVDGYVHGTWALTGPPRTGSTLVISPFRPLPDAQAVHEEAARLAEFIAPGAEVSERPVDGTAR